MKKYIVGTTYPCPEGMTQYGSIGGYALCYDAVSALFICGNSSVDITRSPIVEVMIFPFDSTVLQTANSESPVHDFDLDDGRVYWVVARGGYEWFFDEMETALELVRLFSDYKGQALKIKQLESGWGEDGKPVSARTFVTQYIDRGVVGAELFGYEDLIRQSRVTKTALYAAINGMKKDGVLEKVGDGVFRVIDPNSDKALPPVSEEDVVNYFEKTPGYYVGGAYLYFQMGVIPSRQPNVLDVYHGEGEKKRHLVIGPVHVTIHPSPVRSPMFSSEDKKILLLLDLLRDISPLAGQATPETIISFVSEDLMTRDRDYIDRVVGYSGYYRTRVKRLLGAILDQHPSLSIPYHSLEWTKKKGYYRVDTGKAFSDETRRTWRLFKEKKAKTISRDEEQVRKLADLLRQTEIPPHRDNGSFDRYAHDAIVGLTNKQMDGLNNLFLHVYGSGNTIPANHHFLQGIVHDAVMRLHSLSPSDECIVSVYDIAPELFDTEKLETWFAKAGVLLAPDEVERVEYDNSEGE